MRKILYSVFAVAVAALCVFALAKLREDSEYKMLYSAEISAASEEFSVSQELIYAMVRTESGFDPTAKSKAGAMGLMQLLPSTFEEVAGRLKEAPEPAMIYDPLYSIRYGAFYISYLIRCFGNEEAAIAAYNAGMGNVRSWLADSRYSDDGKTLKAYPYRETENYVNKVVAAREKYKSMIEGMKK